MIINNITENGTDSDTFSTAVVIESICSCSLSIIGSFVIFGTYIVIPDIRNSTRKLVTCLTVADLMTSVGVISSVLAHLAGTQKEVCTPQSFITTYSSLVSFNLTVAIAIHIFTTVVYTTDKTSSRMFLLWANMISWSIPGEHVGKPPTYCKPASRLPYMTTRAMLEANIAIVVGAAGANNVLGRDTTESVGTGPWCWIKRDNTNYALWMFLTGKGWELLCYLITTTLYVLLKFYLFLKYRRRRFTDIHESLRDNDQNYLYVWFVLYVLRLWGSIRSMMSLTGADKHSPGDAISNVLMHMQAFGDPAQAFCNCILFCFLDKTVRSYLGAVCFCATQNYKGVLPEERGRLVIDSGRHRYNEVPSDENDGHNYIRGKCGRYASFDITKQGRQNISDSSSKNISVQSNSSYECLDETNNVLPRNCT